MTARNAFGGGRGVGGGGGGGGDGEEKSVQDITPADHFTPRLLSIRRPRARPSSFASARTGTRSGFRRLFARRFERPVGERVPEVKKQNRKKTHGQYECTRENQIMGADIDAAPLF